MPECRAIGDLREAEHFLDAAVAVRGHHEDRARQLRGAGRNAQHGVVVEFSLLPMFHDLVRSPPPLHQIEQAPERERSRKLVDG